MSMAGRGGTGQSTKLIGEIVSLLSTEPALPPDALDTIKRAILQLRAEVLLIPS